MLPRSLSNIDSKGQGRGMLPQGLPLADKKMAPAVFTHPTAPPAVPYQALPLPLAPPPHMAPPPAPCCPCASLLPRLLSAHRLEVRRLLRGALTTLSRRLDSLERNTVRKSRKRRRAGSPGSPAGSSTPSPPDKQAQLGADQSGSAVSVVLRKNGFKAPPVYSVWTDSQSEATAFTLQWRFSDCAPPLYTFSNHTPLPCLSVVTMETAFSPAPMRHLFTVTMETLLDLFRGGVCVRPQRLLTDWTAPPSLGVDHCYSRALMSTAVSAQRQRRQRANHSTRNLRVLRRRPLPLSVCLTNGLPAPLPAVQSAASAKFISPEKRVSQIRIRRASPRETLLTPMGLPKAKRMKKKEFSLEEIYTNKNYKSPSSNRSLETIFEEPWERGGALLVIGQQKRRRMLLFPDFTQPRKRRKLQGASLAAVAPRKRLAARRANANANTDCDLDVKLLQRLSALHDFLSQQEVDV
ncbi:uncharacterized protein LOC114473146 [Gouania willdenowi]|uniref:uncharacterized protein LOC114473146 n=1 Tax=Gouania willdenowi TaxID=441366 RepID=UPI001056A752|nr:uncharacterized protein LOC114473146 [Gouania willdenowi]